MAVRLRLRRVGRKKAPIYKVVAADSRSPRDGRYIESVGQYEPLRQSNNVEFKEDRVMYWLQNGAQPTDTVRNLLSSQGLWLKWSLLKKGADQAAIGEQMEKFALQRAEKEKRAQEKASQKKKKKAAPETQETPEAQPDAAEQKASKEPSEPAKTPETQEPPAVKEQVSDEPVKETEQETKPDKKAEEKKEETPEDKAENQESEKKE